MTTYNNMTMANETETNANATTKKKIKVWKIFAIIFLFGVLSNMVVLGFTTYGAIRDNTDKIKYSFDTSTGVDGYLIDPSGLPVVGPEDGTMPKYLVAFNRLSSEQKEEVREALRNGDYVIIPSK